MNEKWLKGADWPSGSRPRSRAPTAPTHKDPGCRGSRGVVLITTGWLQAWHGAHLDGGKELQNARTRSSPNNLRPCQPRSQDAWWRTQSGSPLGWRAVRPCPHDESRNQAPGLKERPRTLRCPRDAAPRAGRAQACDHRRALTTAPRREISLSLQTYIRSWAWSRT